MITVRKKIEIIIKGGIENDQQRTSACGIKRREIPDRVPMDLWGTDSRLTTEFYLNLAKHLNFEELGEKESVRGPHPNIEDYRISDMIGSDFRHINIGKPDYYKKL